MSMNMKLEIKGQKEIIADLRRYPNEAPKVYGDAVQKSAQRLRDMTKAHAEIPVDTGRMRQSINSRRISLLAAGVFGGTDYAVVVHEGRTDGSMKPRPFFQWTLRDGAQKAIDAFFAAAMKLVPHK